MELNLSAEPRRWLDFAAEYEFRTGQATPVDEILLETDATAEQSVIEALEALERNGLIELAGHNRNQVYLRRSGVLTCKAAATWNAAGERLLSYLRDRFQAERTKFKEFTWDELKTALQVTDDDFPTFERLIAIFSLSRGGSHGYGPPPNALWTIPAFLAKLRTVKTLAELDELLLQIHDQPPAAGSGSPATAALPRLSEDVATLAQSLYRWDRGRIQSGGPLGMFNSKSAAERLDWPPIRLNRAMNALERAGWLDVDPTGGSAPFDAHGFELNEHGILECERRGLGESVETQSSAPPKGTMQPTCSTTTLNILFMDLAGWSKLSTVQVTGYLQKALPKLADRVKVFHATHQNTWGDALVTTFGSAVDAANCALDIRDFFRRASEAEGVPKGLTPRVSLHVGEVILAYNPLVNREDTFGEAVHLAARLEPVTPHGQVYCTEEFAKSLKAVAGAGPVAHAMGEVDLPKAFGRVMVFAVTGPNEDPPPAPAASGGPQPASAHSAPAPSEVGARPPFR